MGIRYRNRHAPPMIYIDIPTYQQMLFVARATNMEVGWFSEVLPINDGKALLIKHVHVPFQQSNAATVEMEPDDLFKFADEFLSEYDAERYNQVRAWGHSHHTMGVSPSSQDQKMLDTMIDTNGSDFFIAIRINHAGDIQVDYATNAGVTHEDVGYALGYDDGEQEFWEAVVKERLRPIVSQPTYAYAGNRGMVYGSWDDDPYAHLRQGAVRSFGDQTVRPPEKAKGAKGKGRKTAKPLEFDDNLKYPTKTEEKAEILMGIGIDDFDEEFASILSLPRQQAVELIERETREILEFMFEVDPFAYTIDEIERFAEEKYDEIVDMFTAANGSAQGGTDDPGIA